jgi:hypothetical protein
MFEGADNGGIVSAEPCGPPWWAKWVWAALVAPFVLLVLYGLASAQVQLDPRPIQWRSCSGTIAAGGTAQTLSLGSGPLRGFFLQNPSTASESLFFDPSGAASTTAGVSGELIAGNTMSTGPGTIFFGSMSVNAATTGHAYTCLYGK